MSEKSSSTTKFQEFINEQVQDIGCYTNFNTPEKLSINTLALVGEAGELANKLKKYIWYSIESEATLRNQLIDELGDVYFHVAQLATELDITLEDLMQNIITEQKMRGFCCERKKNIINLVYIYFILVN